MSVLIKGMEIPKNCLECMFRISYWERALTPSGKIFTYGCMLNGKEINILEKRCKDCPIDEIPTPHGRLVDSNELLDDFMKAYPVGSPELGCAFEIIESAEGFVKAEVSE